LGADSADLRRGQSFALAVGLFEKAERLAVDGDHAAG